MDAGTETIQLKNQRKKICFMASIIILAGLILFLGIRYLVKEYGRLTYTVNSTHEQIRKLDLSQKQFSDGTKIINAVWDPEVNVFQICLKLPKKDQARSTAVAADLVFCVDGTDWNDTLGVLEESIWSGRYTKIWLECGSGFRTLTVTYKKTGEVLSFTN